MHRFVVGAILVACACAGPEGPTKADRATPPGDAVGAGDSAWGDTPDAGDTDVGGDPRPGDAGAGDAAVAGPELIIEQISLSSSMGESALVVGPDGTSVLIDTGGDGHADNILAAILRRTGERAVDWVVMTHYHFDHTGGFDKLFAPSSDNGNNPVVVRRGVISRGLYDMNGTFIQDDSALQEYCNEITKSSWDGKRFDLCNGSVEFSCDGEGYEDPWPVSDCNGLLLGDLEDPTDDADGALSFIELGEGTRLTFFHANGQVATGDGVEARGGMSHGGTGPENERSLGGMISWGAFQYSFHGDLGSDVEGYTTDRADRVVVVPGGAPLIGTAGVDATKLSHHGISSATSSSWVNWLLPNDGQSRNAVVGTNTGYWFSPASEVLDRVGARVVDGYIWVTHLGTLPGDHARRRHADGAVVIRVQNGGQRYQMFASDNGSEEQLATYTSTQ